MKYVGVDLHKQVIVLCVVVVVAGQRLSPLNRNDPMFSPIEMSPWLRWFTRDLLSVFVLSFRPACGA